MKYKLFNLQERETLFKSVCVAFGVQEYVSCYKLDELFGRDISQEVVRMGQKESGYTHYFDSIYTVATHKGFCLAVDLHNKKVLSAWEKKKIGGGEKDKTKTCKSNKGVVALAGSE